VRVDIYDGGHTRNPQQLRTRNWGPVYNMQGHTQASIHRLCVRVCVYVCTYSHVRGELDSHVNTTQEAHAKREHKMGESHSERERHRCKERKRVKKRERQRCEERKRVKADTQRGVPGRGRKKEREKRERERERERENMEEGKELTGR